MSSRMWARGLVCLCSLVVCAAVVTAQEKKPADEPKKVEPQKIVDEAKKLVGQGEKPAAGQPTPEQMADLMKKMQEYATPGEHHKHLDAMAGNWDVLVRWWMSPDAPPTESKGTSEFKWIFDGRYLEQTADMPAQGPDQPAMKGLGMYGYDNAKKQYFNTWLDNMGTGIMIGWGTCEQGGKVINMAGEYADPMTNQPNRKFRTVTRFVDKDKFVYEMFSPGPDGKEFKMMEITYTRAK
jgi:hypothetical protein